MPRLTMGTLRGPGTDVHTLVPTSLFYGVLHEQNTIRCSVDIQVF
jgi:hypothetical protein